MDIWTWLQILYFTFFFISFECFSPARLVLACFYWNLEPIRATAFIFLQIKGVHLNFRWSLGDIKGSMSLSTSSWVTDRACTFCCLFFCSCLCLVDVVNVWGSGASATVWEVTWGGFLPTGGFLCQSQQALFVFLQRLSLLIQVVHWVYSVLTQSE